MGKGIEYPEKHGLEKLTRGKDSSSQDTRAGRIDLCPVRLESFEVSIEGSHRFSHSRDLQVAESHLFVLNRV